MKEKRIRSIRRVVTVVGLGLLITPGLSQVVTKAQVGELIKRVEDGVDEFKKYLERRSEDARSNPSQRESGQKSSRSVVSDTPAGAGIRRQHRGGPGSDIHAVERPSRRSTRPELPKKSDESRGRTARPWAYHFRRIST